MGLIYEIVLTVGLALLFGYTFAVDLHFTKFKNNVIEDFEFLGEVLGDILADQFYESLVAQHEEELNSPGTFTTWENPPEATNDSEFTGSEGFQRAMKHLSKKPQILPDHPEDPYPHFGNG